MTDDQERAELVERPEVRWTEMGTQYRHRTGVNAAGGVFVALEHRDHEDDDWREQHTWMADSPARVVTVERREVSAP